MKHEYLNIGDSTYKTGYKAVGISTSYGNGLWNTSFTEIQIPSTFDGKKVIEIRKSAFRETQITKIFIPKTILFIDKGAFYKCYQLSEVRFEEESHLEKIGAQCFYGCTKLEKIDLPASIKTIISSSSSQLFFETNKLNCVSYLGTTNFESNYFFSKTPSKILVSPSYPSNKFGQKNITKNNGETCGSSTLLFVLIPKRIKVNKCSRIIRCNTQNFIKYMLVLVYS